MARISAVLALSLAIFCAAVPGVSQTTKPASASQALPPDAPTRDQVMTVLNLLQIRQTMEQALATMTKAMKDGAEQGFRQKVPNPTPKQIAAIHAVIDEALKDTPIDEIIQAIVPVYQKHFTKADLEEMIRFYSSPVGQKALREQPQMMQETAQAAQEIQMKRMNDVLARVDRKVAELMESEDAPQPAKK
jgi:hypothetical protein